MCVSVGGHEHCGVLITLGGSAVGMPPLFFPSPPQDINGYLRGSLSQLQGYVLRQPWWLISSASCAKASPQTVTSCKHPAEVMWSVLVLLKKMKTGYHRGPSEPVQLGNGQHLLIS